MKTNRRGRTLTYEDLERYCKIVTALEETIRLIAEIDAAIPKWPIERARRRPIPAGTDTALS